MADVGRIDETMPPVPVRPLRWPRRAKTRRSAMVFADVDQEVATSEDRNVAFVISTGDRGLTFS